MTEDFTEADLYAEIEKYIASGDDSENEPDTITRPEVCQAFSVGRGKAQAILIEMIKAGVLERAKVSRHNGWFMSRVNGYRLVK